MAAGQNLAVREVWLACARAVAVAFELNEGVISSESRGRGPRPPETARFPKKLAVHLAVVVADCPYAELGRAAGLHRDTVASHCDDMRQAMAEDADMATLSHALAAEARAGLQMGRFDAITEARMRTARLHAQIAKELHLMTEHDPSSDVHPTKTEAFIRQKKPDHENVITLVRGGSAA